MATAKKAATRKTAKRSSAKRSAPKRSAAKRSTGREPAALKRLNKSLESAQDALAALSKEVGKDVGTGARDLQKNLNRFVKDARRDSGKLGTAIQRDIEKLQKRISSASTGRATKKRSTAKRAPAKRSTAKRSTAKRSTAKRTTAKRSSARRPAARRSSARSGSRSRSR